MITVSPPPLPAELSIFTATETRSQWLAWLARESNALTGIAELPSVNASGVDTVDGAGVQLLLALQRTLHERGLTLQLAAPSEILRNACMALGAGALMLTGADDE